jgi:hypothetical protein
MKKAAPHPEVGNCETYDMLAVGVGGSVQVLP